ncbi:MAG: hypothetical protein D6802_03675 [Ardenticatenia bacterium]|nr:MAG: hypothetical protein D6802_03675 [Ardenticatenia bacterium]
MTQPAQLVVCPICQKERPPQMMHTCRECGEQYCSRCSAIRRAMSYAMWSESWHHVPPHWEDRCAACFEKEIAQPRTCASCGKPTDQVDIFWGGVCDKCNDYVCYDCAMAKKRAGGGWEAPGGVWDFRCRKHVGFLKFGWQTPERPPNYEGQKVSKGV